jgi:hypothetical protein
MSNYDQFIQSWDGYMHQCIIGSVILAILVLVFHEIRKITIRDFKERYDFITRHEIRYLWYVILILILAVMFFSNTFLSEWIERKGQVWFAGRAFISICLGVILYYLSDSIVRVYYLGVVEHKLIKLRNRPRISPDGNVMRKLSEQEEDAHLEASQIAEEAAKGEIHSVDYDVWLDEKTGFKKIEKYYSFEHAIECSECGYVTLKIAQEEVTLQPTEYGTGELVKHYKCSFCGHRERRVVNLAKLSDNI